MHTKYFEDHGWPNQLQADLLQICLAPKATIGNRWNDWRKRINLEDLDLASFFVCPIAFRRLEAAGITDSASKKLGGIFRFSWAKNQRLRRAVIELASQLEQSGVQTCVVKGLHLAEVYYENMGERMMADADLLIKADSVHVARESMRRAGWQTPGNVSDIPAEFFVAAEFRKDETVRVDLQTRPYKVGAPASMREEFWARVKPHEAISSSVSDQSDLLLNILMQCRTDPQNRLRWVVDTHKVLATETINLNEIATRANRLGVLAPILDAMLYLSREWKLEPAIDFLKLVGRYQPSKQELATFRTLFRSKGRCKAIWHYYHRYCRDQGKPTSALSFPKLVIKYATQRHRTLNPARLVREIYKQEMTARRAS